jgi:four helix bundle protein
MNTTEGTMSKDSQQSKHGLDAHTLALQAAGIILAQALTVSGPMKSVAGQLIRAASSVALNLAEGNGRFGRDRMHHWRIAYGSALESSSAMQLLTAARCLDPVAASQAEKLLDRVRAMTWRLINPRR